MENLYNGYEEDICSVMKDKYYQDMEKMHEEYDIFLHDMKHTMRTIAALAEAGDCGEIGRLVKGLGTSLENIEWRTICAHKILNALLVEAKKRADDNGVILNLDIREPLYFQNIEDVDIIALIGNLLDNAVMAEKEVKSKEGISCSIGMSREGCHVLIQIENAYAVKSYDKEKDKDKGQRRDIGTKHGIGCKSVERIVKKYGGMMNQNTTDGLWRVKILLPVQDEPGTNTAGEASKAANGGLKQPNGQ